MLSFAEAGHGDQCMSTPPKLQLPQSFSAWQWLRAISGLDLHPGWDSSNILSSWGLQEFALPGVARGFQHKTRSFSTRLPYQKADKRYIHPDSQDGELIQCHLLQQACWHLDRDGNRRNAGTNENAARRR